MPRPASAEMSWAAASAAPRPASSSTGARSSRMPASAAAMSAALAMRQPVFPGASMSSRMPLLPPSSSVRICRLAVPASLAPMRWRISQPSPLTALCVPRVNGACPGTAAWSAGTLVSRT